MMQSDWCMPNRNIVLCIDSCDEGVLVGRFYTHSREMERFSSLTQFLVKLEELLDEQQQPQSYTRVRRFSAFLEPTEDRTHGAAFSKGSKATFDLQVLFRQHSSWQGLLSWREGNAEHSFRSVLELIMLMDSALRSLEGSDVA